MCVSRYSIEGMVPTWEVEEKNEEAIGKDAKVTRSKAQEMDEELATPAGERNIYRITKARDKSTTDFTHKKRLKMSKKWFYGDMVKSRNDGNFILISY